MCHNIQHSCRSVCVLGKTDMEWRSTGMYSRGKQNERSNSSSTTRFMSEVGWSANAPPGPRQSGTMEGDNGQCKDNSQISHKTREQKIK